MQANWILLSRTKFLGFYFSSNYTTRWIWFGFRFGLNQMKILLKKLNEFCIVINQWINRLKQCWVKHDDTLSDQKFSGSYFYPLIAWAFCRHFHALRMRFDVMREYISENFWSEWVSSYLSRTLPSEGPFPIKINLFHFFNFFAYVWKFFKYKKIWIRFIPRSLQIFIWTCREFILSYWNQTQGYILNLQGSGRRFHFFKLMIRG